MTKSYDYIRSFGMSGMLLIEELINVEDKFGVQLGHGESGTKDNPAEYYPQFEQSVRNEAAEMSNHYELFYCLEQSIRKLITEILKEAEPTSWWESGRVPAQIVKDVKDRIQKETDSGITIRSEASIDYTTFGELSVIIASNWDLFGAVFSSRRAVEKVMNNLNVLRGPIAHCCPISEDEIDRLRLAVKDWFRLIG